MARLKFFPRSRRPSLGELLGINQAARQVSRKHHLRICSIRCRRSRTRSDGQRGAGATTARRCCLRFCAACAACSVRTRLAWRSGRRVGNRHGVNVLVIGAAIDD